MNTGAILIADSPGTTHFQINIDKHVLHDANIHTLSQTR